MDVSWDVLNIVVLDVCQEMRRLESTRPETPMDPVEFTNSVGEALREAEQTAYELNRYNPDASYEKLYTELTRTAAEALHAMFAARKKIHGQ